MGAVDRDGLARILGPEGVAELYKQLVLFLIRGLGVTFALELEHRYSPSGPSDRDDVSARQIAHMRHPMYFNETLVLLVLCTPEVVAAAPATNAPAGLKVQDSILTCIHGLFNAQA